MQTDLGIFYTTVRRFTLLFLGDLIQALFSRSGRFFGANSAKNKIIALKSLDSLSILPSGAILELKNDRK
jgi:hypothetical protein